MIAMCHHVTPCPEATSEARDLAAVVSSHPEQGWSLLCNGVVLFDDDGELLPTAAPSPTTTPGWRRNSPSAEERTRPSHRSRARGEPPDGA